MLFFGGLALLLNTLLLGALWPHRARHELGAGLWGYMVKALFLSWFWFLLSFFTGLGSIAQILVGALFVFTAFRFVTSDGLGGAPFEQGASWRLAAFWLVVVFMSLPALSTLGSTFVGWDAIVSWNRWAIGFTDNQYMPVAAAYPVLWPAIWSLIYEAQATSLYWFAAKATLIVPPALISIYASSKLWSGRYLSGGYLCVSLYFLFLSAPPLVSGYMDTPVALMGLAALLLVTEGLDTSPDDARRNDIFLFAAISASLAIVTKQAGALFAVAVFISLAYLLVKRELGLRFGALLAAIMAAPMATFLGLYLAHRPSLIGNIDQLRALVDAARGGESKVAHALEILVASQSWTILALLGIGVICNIVFARSRAGAFGMLCCAMAAIGFFVFADCCSYQARNGLWIYSFILASGWIGVRRLEALFSVDLGRISLPAPPLKGGNRAMIGALIAGYVIGFLALGAEWPSAKLIARHDKILVEDASQRWINSFLWSNRELLEKYPFFVSNYPIANYLGFTRGKFKSCRFTTEACISSYSDANKLLLIFSVDDRENEESKAFIASSLTRGTARVLAGGARVRFIEFRSDAGKKPAN